MKQMLLIFSSLLSIASLNSCGEKNIINNRGSFSSISGAVSDNANADKFTGCVASSSPAKDASLSLADINYDGVDPSKSLLVNDRSFCDSLLESKKKVAIYQFAHESCVECLKQIENIKLAIEQSEYSKSIAHIVILTSESKELTQSIKDISSNIIIDYDPQKSAWSSLSEDKESYDIATVFAVALSQDSALINKPEDTYLDIVPEAIKLFKKEVPKGKSNNIFEDILNTLTWDGKKYLGNTNFDIISIK